MLSSIEINTGQRVFSAIGLPSIAFDQLFVDAQRVLVVGQFKSFDAASQFGNGFIVA